MCNSTRPATSWRWTGGERAATMLELDDPRAVRLGRVVYTDTWLWDESGRFQLDTLSEGQLGQDD